MSILAKNVILGSGRFLWWRCTILLVDYYIDFVAMRCRARILDHANQSFNHEPRTILIGRAQGNVKHNFGLLVVPVLVLHDLVDDHIDCIAMRFRARILDHATQSFNIGTSNRFP